MDWPTAVQEWAESVQLPDEANDHLFSPKDALSQPKKVADSFNAWEDLVWTKENALFLWTNMLRLIGHPNGAADRPEIWQLIVKTLSNVQHQLLKIRTSQHYDVEHLPPVYELVPWLLTLQIRVSTRRDFPLAQTWHWMHFVQ